jgi:hypothetical protein
MLHNPVFLWKTAGVDINRLLISTLRLPVPVPILEQGATLRPIRICFSSFLSFLFAECVALPGLMTGESLGQ